MSFGVQGVLGLVGGCKRGRGLALPLDLPAGAAMTGFTICSFHPPWSVSLPVRIRCEESGSGNYVTSLTPSPWTNH